MKLSSSQFAKNGIVFTECLLYSPIDCFSPQSTYVKDLMSDYAHLDFTTWSSKAELVGDVADVLPPQLVKQYSDTSLQRPGYVFRDGIDNSYRSFIISDDDRKWWSILWTGDRVQADNLLDVAIDVWQSRLRNVLDES